MNTALKTLRELALSHSRTKYPNMPEYARSCKNYTDRTSNGLQKCIIDYLRFSAMQCERIAVTGRYLDNSKVITDVIGSKRRIGSGKWIRSSMQKGSADLSAIIKNKDGIGISVKIEIKHGKYEKQSPDQVAYQQQVEAAGGIYLIIRSFEEFLVFYNAISI